MIFSISVVESSNLCIIGIILSWFLFDSYHSEILVLVVIVMTRLSHSKTIFGCIFYCVFGGVDFADSLVRKVRTFLPIPKSPLPIIIWLLSRCGFRACFDLQYKRKFIKNGFRMKDLLHFWFRGLPVIYLERDLTFPYLVLPSHVGQWCFYA